MVSVADERPTGLSPELAGTSIELVVSAAERALSEVGIVWLEVVIEEPAVSFVDVEPDVAFPEKSLTIAATAAEAAAEADPACALTEESLASSANLAAAEAE